MIRKTSALIPIEFQYEWLNPQGKLYRLMQDQLQFKNSVEQATKAITYARNQNMLCIHSGLSFAVNYQELGEAKFGLRHHIRENKPFQKDSLGSQFFEPFSPLPGELQVQGRLGGSAFASSNLDQLLKNNDIKKIYLMGYALHVCVESTLRAAHDLGYETYVIHDACSAFNLEQKEFFLTHIIHHFGKAISTAEFLSGE